MGQAWRYRYPKSGKGDLQVRVCWTARGEPEWRYVRDVNLGFGSCCTQGGEKEWDLASSWPDSASSLGRREQLY